MIITLQFGFLSNCKVVVFPPKITRKVIYYTIYSDVNIIKMSLYTKGQTEIQLQKSKSIHCCQTVCTFWFYTEVTAWYGFTKKKKFSAIKFCKIECVFYKNVEILKSLISLSVQYI